MSSLRSGATARSRRIVSRSFVALVLVAATFAVTAPGPAVAVAAAPLPTVSPTPQQMTSLGADVPVPDTFRISVTAPSDGMAAGLARDILRAHGASETTSTDAGLTVYVGGPGGNPETADALAAMGLAMPTGLPKEGYLLATGPGRAVLAGIDRVGTYYAAQTLRQLVRAAPGGAVLPAVKVVDFPAFPFRGGEESFYGPAWSWQDRYDQVDFLAAHKMNYFFYGPAADDRTTGRGWRNLYDAATLAQFRDLVGYSHARHVKFLYRVGPGAPDVGSPADGICHASQADRAALVARLEQMYSVGVRRFVISWDDVRTQFACTADQQRYGGLAEPFATAQAEVLNYVQAAFFDAHPDVEPGLTIPVQYFGNDPSGYRTTFDTLVTTKMQFYWTGPAVISHEIEDPDAAAAQRAFPRHKLLVFDNYPVNDYVRERLLLGPVAHRGPQLANRIVGISWNEMNEQGPSQVALFTAADYAWNPAAYDPEASWDRGLRELGGAAYPALKVFADANRYSTFLWLPQAPELRRLVDTYRSAYDSGAPLAVPAAALRDRFAAMRAARAQLAAAMPRFAAQADPWLRKLNLYGVAGQRAVDLVDATLRRDDAAAATLRQQLTADQAALAAVRQPDQRAVHVALETMDPFLAFAASEYDRGYAAAFSAPYGLQPVAAGGTTAVSIDVVVRDDATYQATLTAAVPAGWRVTPASQPVSIASDRRTRTQRYTFAVSAPAGAGPGSVTFQLVRPGAAAVTRSLPLYPFASGSGSYQDLVLAANPQGYWRLGDAAGSTAVRDISGHALHGSYRGPAVPGAPGALTRDADTAVDFRGGYAEVPHPAATAPTGAWTVEAWVRTRRPHTSDAGQSIVEKYSPPARNGFLLRLDSANRVVAMTMNGATAAGVTSTVALGPNEWHHVAATFDGARLQVYVDGLQFGSVATTVRPTAGPQSLKIGARGDDRETRFDGSVDEVALYLRAVPQGELVRHFLRGLAYETGPTGP